MRPPYSSCVCSPSKTLRWLYLPHRVHGLQRRVRGMMMGPTARRRRGEANLARRLPCGELCFSLVARASLSNVINKSDAAYTPSCQDETSTNPPGCCTEGGHYILVPVSQQYHVGYSLFYVFPLLADKRSRVSFMIESRSDFDLGVG